MEAEEPRDQAEEVASRELLDPRQDPGGYEPIVRMVARPETVAAETAAEGEDNLHKDWLMEQRPAGYW